MRVVVSHRDPSRAEARRQGSRAPVAVYASRAVVVVPGAGAVRRDKIAQLDRALKRAADVRWTAAPGALTVTWSRGPGLRGGVCLVAVEAVPA